MIACTRRGIIKKIKKRDYNELGQINKSWKCSADSKICFT